MLEIASARVSLRDLTEGDLESVHAIVGDPKVTERLSFDQRSLVEAKQMLDGVIERAQHEPRTEYYLAITDDRSMVGFARLGLAGVSAAKLGYAVAAPYWGFGYATDAVRTMVRFGFEALALHRISAAIGPDNHASIRVVEKAGFVYEGRLRHHVHTNSAWRDSLLYSILADEGR